MKHKKLIITIIIILIILICVILGLKFKNKNNKPSEMPENFKQETEQNMKQINEQLQNNENNESEKNKNLQTETLKQNSEIESACIEKVTPHTTYYLEELYVVENEYIEKDTRILKYTNGTYLTAPYNCVITELNLPNSEEKILNTHYIEIKSTNILSVSMNISESKINNINIGDEVEITVSSLDKTYTGYVTNIASIANNKKFEIKVEFENNGNVKLGMTASCKLIVEK